jgi:PTH2 family peptidyl-tRNA hydrolase
MSAQVGHACVEAVLKSDKSLVKEWRASGMPKIVVKVEDKAGLYKFLQIAKDAGLTTALITDAGRTCIAPGTETCLAIGPDEDEKIDAITGDLKLM